MAATFNEPVTLSKHDISPKTTHDSTPILASCSKGSKSEYATTGVHGEGINIIDLTSLQPEAATLLGPDSSFACSPVTRVIEKGHAELRRQTYAVLNAAQSESVTKRSQTLSLWTSTEGLASLQQEQSVTLERPVAALYAPTSMPGKVVLISPEGVITTYDSELQQSEEDASSSASQKLLFSFMFDSSQCSFARASHLPSDGGILVLILKRKKDCHLRVCSLGESVEAIGEARLQLQDISSASCNKDGCLTLLDKDESLFSYMIERQRDGIAVSSLERLRLQGLHPAGMSICSVASTHVLVAAFEKASPDIALLLWDVQFGVLLVERKLPKPAALSSISHDRLRLQIVPCGVGQSLISICSTKAPNRTDTSGSGLKAVIMVVPHTIPTTSSLANAIGRAIASDKWLTDAPQPPVSSESHNDGREVMLAGVTEAIKAGNANAADKIFFEWETQQRALVKALAKEEAKRQMAALAPKRAVNGTSTKGDATLGEGKDAQPEPKVFIKHISTQIDWGHSFLTRLMEIVLNPKNATYSSKIPAYFLERKLIGDGIVEGGVLKRLQERDDWVSIRWSLRSTVDVSEDDLISLLLCTVQLHREKHGANKAANAMDVDDPTSQLTLSQVFGYIIAYPTSTPPLRLAIRQHFSRAEDVVVLIETANNWISDSAKKTLVVKVGKMEEGLKPGEQAAQDKTVEKDGLPRLDLLIAFLSCLLDAVLLDLLQYRPAHRLLRIMSGRLRPYAPYLETLDRLRGPLEPFVKAERRSRRPWEDHKKSQKVQDREKDNHSLNANLYQVEEFFV